MHVKHKHGICAKDYKAQYGLLLATPLVHSEISAALSDCIKRRLSDDEYREEVADQCRKNGAKSKSGLTGWFSPAASAAIGLSNSKRNDEYLQARAATVQECLNRTGVISHTAKELRMAANTIKEMARRGLIELPAKQKSTKVKVDADAE